MFDEKAENERVPQTSYKQKLVALTKHGKSENGYWFSACNGDYNQCVGTRLTKAVRYAPRTRIEDFGSLPVVLEERQTDIRIGAIRCYGEDILTVPPHMTCLMSLEGSDTEWLSGDWCFE